MRKAKHYIFLGIYFGVAMGLFQTFQSGFQPLFGLFAAVFCGLSVGLVMWRYEKWVERKIIPRRNEFMQAHEVLYDSSTTRDMNSLFKNREGWLFLTREGLCFISRKPSEPEIWLYLSTIHFPYVRKVGLNGKKLIIRQKGGIEHCFFVHEPDQWLAEIQKYIA